MLSKFFEQRAAVALAMISVMYFFFHSFVLLFISFFLWSGMGELRWHM